MKAPTYTNEVPAHNVLNGTNTKNHPSSQLIFSCKLRRKEILGMLQSCSQEFMSLIYPRIGFPQKSSQKKKQVPATFLQRHFKQQHQTTVNPRLEVDLHYKSTLLEVGLYRHVLPLCIIKTLLLECFQTLQGPLYHPYTVRINLR